MLHLEIKIDGKTPGDIERILQQVTRMILLEEYQAGSDSHSYTFAITGEDETTYSLLVSNVGWVRSDCPNYNAVKKLYDEYVASKEYGQVTLWSSAQDDPIEFYYDPEHPDNHDSYMNELADNNDESDL